MSLFHFASVTHSAVRIFFKSHIKTFRQTVAASLEPVFECFVNSDVTCIPSSVLVKAVAYSMTALSWQKLNAEKEKGRRSKLASQSQAFVGRLRSVDLCHSEEVEGRQVLGHAGLVGVSK